ncbi:MAG: hypothetical protein ACI8X5_004308 [Planctomycetota bacterium]|jgi:hypothetical protein
MALATYDDGNGEKLYMAGGFSAVGSLTAGNIASWNGSRWSALGLGIGGLGIASMYPAELRSLGVFDSGNGAKLYAGGIFTKAGLVSTVGIASWNGTA